MRRLHAALAMPLLIGGTLVWLALNVAEAKQTLAYLTESFERTLNPTDLPDYKVNGLLVHTNDGWADIEVLKRSKELGFVSMSYIRRDISQNHKMPIFFDPSYRDVPWMHNDLVGTGIILDPGGAFVPLCMFIRDAASYNRSHFGCGGYKNRVIENLTGADTSPVMASKRFRLGFITRTWLSVISRMFMILDLESLLVTTTALKIFLTMMRDSSVITEHNAPLQLIRKVFHLHSNFPKSTCASTMSFWFRSGRI